MPNHPLGRHDRCAGRRVIEHLRNFNAMSKLESVACKYSLCAMRAGSDALSTQASLTYVAQSAVIRLWYDASSSPRRAAASSSSEGAAGC